MNVWRPLAMLLATILTITAMPSPSLAAMAVLTVVDEANRPVTGASVTLTSANGSYTSVTGADGVVSINVPPDTYSAVVSIPGFDTETLGGIVVTGDVARTLTVRLQHLYQATPPPPPPPPRASPPPTSRALVHDSLLSVFDSQHPEHVGGEPYFGRYSYVLLRDGDESVRQRNRFLIGILVDRFVAIGSTIQPGAPRDVDNPWGYNAYFLPMRNGAFGPIEVTSKAAVVDRLISDYDFAAARNMRDRYCAVVSHQRYAACVSPYDSGPFILTFLAPLPAASRGEAYPPALAYDFSSVDTDQFGAAESEISRSISISSAIMDDRILPPSFVVKYVAPLLKAIAAALEVSVNGVRLLMDAGLKGR